MLCLYIAVENRRHLNGKHLLLPTILIQTYFRNSNRFFEFLLCTHILLATICHRSQNGRMRVITKKKEKEKTGANPLASFDCIATPTLVLLS